MSHFFLYGWFMHILVFKRKYVDICKALQIICLAKTIGHGWLKSKTQPFTV